MPTDTMQTILQAIAADPNVDPALRKVYGAAANLDKPTRTELLAENARLKADLVTARRYQSDAIITNFAPQCVPHGDWSAHRKDYEPGMALGHGSTEALAVTDLFEQENERDE